MVEPGIETVYLVHFDDESRRRRHYVGFTRKTPEARLEEHRRAEGTTSRQFRSGDGKIVRTWPGEGEVFEESLKRKKNLADWCPVCSPASVAKHATESRVRA